MRQFCRIFYCLAWFDTVECNRLPCPKSKIYDDAVFAGRFRCQLNMFGFSVLIGLSRLIHTHIACEIDTAKNYRSNLPNFLSFAWFHTLEFNRLPWSNTKMYDDAVFADRFRYQLTMSGIRCIDRAISTPSCSYSIWNRYSQNHRSIVRNYLLFEWFDTLEFNR